MKKLIIFIAKLRSNAEIRKMYRRIEKDERRRGRFEKSDSAADEYLKLARFAISKAKSDCTYEESLHWLGIAKRYSIRFFKAKTGT